MREKIAKGVCLLALGIVTTLSYLFAVLHNPTALAETGRDTVAPPLVVPAEVTPPATTPATPPAPGSPANDLSAPGDPVAAQDKKAGATPSDIERGRAAYAQHNCATCHSIGGTGNPRYPLDGTGDRWEPDELREWIIGAGIAAEMLSPAIRRRKQRYQSMPAEQLSALVHYMSGLKEPRRP